MIIQLVRVTAESIAEIETDQHLTDAQAAGTRFSTTVNLLYAARVLLLALVITPGLAAESTN